MSYSEDDVEKTRRGRLLGRGKADCRGERASLLRRIAVNLLALGNWMKDWYSSHSTQGHLPNVHIDD